MRSRTKQKFQHGVVPGLVLWQIDACASVVLVAPQVWCRRMALVQNPMIKTLTTGSLSISWRRPEHLGRNSGRRSVVPVGFRAPTRLTKTRLHPTGRMVDLSSGTCPHKSTLRGKLPPDRLTSPFMGQYQLSVALTHYGQFDPGGKLTQSNEQDDYIKEQLGEIFTDIVWGKPDSPSYFNSRAYLSLGPDKKGPDKRNPSVKAVMTRGSVCQDKF